MAESALCQVVLENLVSLIQDEIGLIMGVDEEMKKLRSSFTTIQAVLQDAEDKKLESKELQDWLCKLKDQTFEIEDILDECATHVSKMNLRNSKLSCCSLQDVVFRHDIGTRMKQLTKKLDAVAAEREKFGLTKMPAIENTTQVHDGRATGSMLNQSHQVYGREEDQEKIIDILVNGVIENQQISVLPIIGVGGLGKTTLAQSVYNNQRVIDHFEKRLWICVSDNFDQETLVRAMIESATGSGSASDLLQLDTLQRRLWELLSGKRYLLVLDDVWNTDQEKWCVLKNVLSCGSNGTSIIVTTRLRMVADLKGTLPPHCLKGLSDHDCWMLMRERAFTEDEKDKYPNLEAIGKQIVKKCAGVPMAVKALGGLLRFKRTEKEWIYVKESELWNLPEGQTLILPSLRLSYHHLPLELRQCFVYFAVFPKDFYIEKEELIYLWMAHGYISSNGSLEVENVGDQICNELLLRSLFQYRPFNTNYIMMHDLVHDLAQSIMENKVPGVQVEGQVTSTSNYTKIRQVNLRDKLVAFPTNTRHDMDLSSILAKFSRLRVLDASDKTTIKDLPSTIGNLKHLRFLNLSKCEIRTLPSSLCSLWNLQNLNLDYCSKLVSLPKNIRYLKNLRHLCLESCLSLERMPSKIGELTCLKTLSMFIVGHDRGNQLEELQSLNIGGKLEIKHLERVGSYMDAKKANLVDKEDLRHLSLEWESNGASESRADIDEKVLEALQPHPNLESLRIQGFNGRMTFSILKNVVRMNIVDCPHCLHLSQLEKLPRLEFLRLEKVGVEYMIEDENAVDTLLFPSLKTLELCSLPHLKGVLMKEQVSTQVFPNLRELKIDSCSSIDENAVDTLLFPSLKTLELCSLPNLKGVLKEEVSTQVFPNLETLKIDSCSSIVLPQLSSLQKLDIQNCGGLMLTSFAKLEALTDLTVGFGENVKSIPMETLEKLTNLKRLEVVGPDEESLPEEGLRALKSLTAIDIVGSMTLRCLPIGWLQHLTALKTVIVRDCPELVELPEEIKDLNYLDDVRLGNVAKMVCLPKALRHLSSLKELYLWRLPQLNTLPDWLEDLTSLETLFIYECPKLVSLPASIQRMPSLEILFIRECPELVRRCERGSGEDWQYISHINIDID